MNLLLVIPRYEIYPDGHYVMPLGILYVSSYLKRNTTCNVFTLNMNHIEGTEEEVLGQALTDNSIDMMGIGGLSGEYSDIQRIVTLARRLRPSLRIVVGGGLMSGDPQTTMLAMPEVDYGVVGEGEQTMADLVSSSLLPLTSPLLPPGLIYRLPDGTLRTTPPRTEFTDLDTLPLPDYEGFNYDLYLRNNPDLSDPGKKYSQVSVIGGRSCKYNCTFCFHPSGSRYRQRSLDSIFSEIDYLVDHYNISYIALREELFATDLDRVRQFAQRVEPYNFDWSIQLRIDNICPELIDILRDTRCRYIFLGIESADNTILRSMHKGITIAQIEQALQLATDAGLTVRSGVILGDTAETVETYLRTIAWYRRHVERYSLYCDLIIAFPGSIIYRRAVTDGIIPDPVQFLRDGCPIVNLTTMNDSDFMEMVHLSESYGGRKYDVKFYRHKPHTFES